MVVFIIIVTVLCIIGLIGIFSSDCAYTDQEWDEQCKKDFKKYGKVPDDYYIHDEL